MRRDKGIFKEILLPRNKLTLINRQRCVLDTCVMHEHAVLFDLTSQQALCSILDLFWCVIAIICNLFAIYTCTRKSEGWKGRGREGGRNEIPEDFDYNLYYKFPVKFATSYLRWYDNISNDWLRKKDHICEMSIVIYGFYFVSLFLLSIDVNFFNFL